MLRAFTDYESVVEYVEALPDDEWFSVQTVWRTLGAGFSLLTYTRYAVRDMHLHGLVRCVRRTRDGRCLAYVRVSATGETGGNTQVGEATLRSHPLPCTVQPCSCGSSSS